MTLITQTEITDARQKFEELRVRDVALQAEHSRAFAENNETRMAEIGAQIQAMRPELKRAAVLWRDLTKQRARQLSGKPFNA